MSYEVWYARVCAFFDRHPKLLQFLRLYNRLMTLIIPFVFAGLLWQVSWRQVGIYLAVTGTGFVLLSLVRKRLNQARPYEMWAIRPLLEKDSRGNSMPSRHVFSATVISMAVCHYHPLLGGLFLLLSVGLAWVRVLGGVHYPKDVLVGYLLGVMWGSILYLF